MKVSGSVVSNSLRSHGLNRPWNSPGQNTGVGSLSLLQGIFPTQGLNPGLPYCRRILYQLSHKGSTLLVTYLTYSIVCMFIPSSIGHFLNYLLIFKNFWLHWVSVAVCRFSLVAADRGCSLVAMHGLHTVLASLVVEHRL